MMGTWKLTESKSKMTRGTGKNAKVVYDSKRLGQGRWEITGDGVDADGSPFIPSGKGNSTAKITK
jgi:hypothetical protein